MPTAAHLVVVHRDRGAVCRQTVERFLAQADLTVTVVDNGSEPAELADLRDGLSGDVEVVEAGSNLGFGPGANVGLKRWLAGPHEICLLAPHDARPLDGTVRRLLEEMRARPSAGLACADVGDGEVPRIQPYLGPHRRARLRGADGWEEADYPHGTLMALRRECLHRRRRHCSTSATSPTARRRTWASGPRRAGWEVGLVRGALVDNPESGSEAATHRLPHGPQHAAAAGNPLRHEYNAVFRAAVVARRVDGGVVASRR